MGHAVFHFNDGKLELRKHSGAEVEVNSAWITRTTQVTEGLPSQPYIHLDIRTPFGESVNDRMVAEAVEESLGPRRDKFAVGGWHIQFVEDTNLGSNHRVFVDLIENGAEARGLTGMDLGLPLDVAVEALGEVVAAEKGEGNFQLLIGGSHFCYSLLYLNGAAFHLLRVPEGAGPKAAERLVRHREFLLSQGKNGSLTLKTYIGTGDLLLGLDPINALRPEALNFGLEADPSMILHLGLAHASRQKEFLGHNRVGDAERKRNHAIRTRNRFWQTLSATAAACLLIAAGYALSIQHTQSQLKYLRAQAAAYQSQVDSIKALRREKNRLENSMEALRPLWVKPVAWSPILTGITAALPREAGIDGLSVTRQSEGGLELSFRAWVKDWDQVQSIQKRLSLQPHLRAVQLSEQRKDLQTGVVVFHVSCKLDRT